MNDPRLVENGQEVSVHHSKRFCPVLSLVSLNQAEGAKGPHLSACRGVACMFFRPQLVPLKVSPLAAANGPVFEIVGGVCAIGEIAHNTGAQAQLMNTLVENLGRKK